MEKEEYEGDQGRSELTTTKKKTLREIMRLANDWKAWKCLISEKIKNPNPTPKKQTDLSRRRRNINSYSTSNRERHFDGC